jgi:hypothetical protein
MPIGLRRLEQVQLSFHDFIFPRGCDSQAGEPARYSRAPRPA